MTRRSALVVGAVALVAVVATAGCGSTPNPASAPRPRATASGPASRAPASWRPTHAVASMASWRLPLRVARAATTSIGGDPHRTVLAGGMLPSGTSTTRVSVLDPATGRHTPGPGLVVPVHDAAGGFLGARPAVFGGGNTSEQSVVQALSGDRWRPAGQLPTTRSDLSVVTVAGSSLVIGGYDGSNVPREILRAGARGLVPHGALRRGVRYAATAAVGRSVYVLGGEVDHRELGVVQRVDAGTGKTAVVATLPRPLGHAMAVGVGGRVLLMGGRTGPDTQTDAMWWFDPASGHFTRAGKLPTRLSDASVVVIGRQAWLLGGETPSVTDRVVAVRLS